MNSVDPPTGETASALDVNEYPQTLSSFECVVAMVECECGRRRLAPQSRGSDRSTTFVTLEHKTLSLSDKLGASLHRK